MMASTALDTSTTATSLEATPLSLPHPSNRRRSGLVGALHTQSLKTGISSVMMMTLLSLLAKPSYWI